ncbi:NADH-quinone oxidoreductase subunit E [Rhodosalinus sp. 5P4]|uniref:NADH-quinone oxidoreductase subunit E n=1 Tax=Rhodosalinus sp. 5P4 TaxID=3239196 RepID=UPI003524458E
MLRRLHHEQPESFAFTPANLEWARAQMTKYPEGRQASAIIPLLWRAQEQEGWLSRPAIEYVADLLGLAHIRALEVATFYFMFQLAPVGSVAHVQVCGTTSCMICGAEDLIGVCREKIAREPHELSPDGKFSWEEVECLGACSNAPMAQIGKDYYEDLTAGRLGEILDALAAGEVPLPGPQRGRYASEPAGGLTSLHAHGEDRLPRNASVALAEELGDTVKRIDGSEVPLVTPWRDRSGNDTAPEPDPHSPVLAEELPADDTGIDRREAPVKGRGKPESGAPAPEARLDPDAPRPEPDAADLGTRPEGLEAPREGGPDDLKKIKGIGKKLEKLLHGLGFYHFDQIAGWTAKEIAWVDQNLEGFKGRVTRDNWVEQARVLSEGGETDFSERVSKGDVY